MATSWLSQRVRIDLRNDDDFKEFLSRGIRITWLIVWNHLNGSTAQWSGIFTFSSSQRVTTSCLALTYWKYIQCRPLGIRAFSICGIPFSWNDSSTFFESTVGYNFARNVKWSRFYHFSVIIPSFFEWMN